ncbi:MAG TPA: hypothetical protein VFK47_22345, partial [Ktedonobacteraceae bacterium]|nr:hypothetical protein [Ktedonobacteraceae bacterium]
MNKKHIHREADADHPTPRMFVASSFQILDFHGCAYCFCSQCQTAYRRSMDWNVGLDFAATSNGMLILS